MAMAVGGACLAVLLAATVLGWRRRRRRVSVFRCPRLGDPLPPVEWTERGSGRTGTVVLDDPNWQRALRRQRAEAKQRQRGRHLPAPVTERDERHERDEHIERHERADVVDVADVDDTPDVVDVDDTAAQVPADSGVVRISTLPTRQRPRQRRRR